MSRIYVALLAGLWALALTVPAHAYLDPQNSSLLMQAAAAGLAGLSVLVRILFRHLLERVNSAFARWARG